MNDADEKLDKWLEGTLESKPTDVSLSAALSATVLVMGSACLVAILIAGTWRAVTVLWP